MTTVIEYIWVGGNNSLRSKNRVLNQLSHIHISEIPEWNFDGSSTGQADTQKSELKLKPVKMCRSPFKYVDYLVLCEVINQDGSPHETNTRSKVSRYFDLNDNNNHTSFGFEQEFFCFDINTNKPLFDKYNYRPQGDYYCAVGSQNISYRNFLLKALDYCRRAGLGMTGSNFEVAPDQMELQVRANGVDAADQLILLRYILHRLTEGKNFYVSFEPKPLTDLQWNGSGCHANYSTELMRDENGFEHITKTIKQLEKTHIDDVKNYGKDNEKRLTGTCETSSMNEFSFGVADRTASVRIPSDVVKDKKGYFEDRRPAGNMDPYIISYTLLKATVDSEKSDAIIGSVDTKINLENDFKINHKINPNVSTFGVNKKDPSDNWIDNWVENCP